MADIKKFPNRSPRVNTAMTTQQRGYQFFGDVPKNPRNDAYRGLLRTLDSARKPANMNVRPKLDVTDPRFSSRPGKNKPTSKAAGPSMGSRIAGAAGTVARGMMRAAGPVGALVGMTKPAGLGSDKPTGPLMRGNSKPKGKMAVPGGRGITAITFGGSSKDQSRVPASRGGSSKDQSRVPTSRSGGFMGPSKTTSKPSGGMRSGPGATGGSKTAGRSTSSKSNLGTSRF